MRARVHLIIEGRVQGVAYRYFTRDVAAALGLEGWVRNLYDGNVEAVFEGERDRVEKAVEQCRQGPPFAVVTNITASWTDQPEGLRDFRILR